MGGLRTYSRKQELEHCNPQGTAQGILALIMLTDMQCCGMLNTCSNFLGFAVGFFEDLFHSFLAVREPAYAVGTQSFLPHAVGLGLRNLG